MSSKSQLEEEKDYKHTLGNLTNCGQLNQKLLKTIGIIPYKVNADKVARLETK